MQLLLQIARPPWWDSTANSLRVQATSGTISTVSTITTISTVSALTNVSQVDTYQGKQIIINLNMASWELSCRNRII